MIAIIVPFYQRQPGLLQRAVRSVLAQGTKAPWHLYIVDDGSPVSSAEELAELRPLLEDRLTVLKQPNGGISSARNRALEALPADTEIAAFLDSDDEWDSGHLDRVATAFAAGADFYFSDCKRDWSERSWHDEIGFRPASHVLFDHVRKLYWFRGHFFDALLRRSPALVSTVALRFSAVPALRFAPGLSPGEDIYFWMQAMTTLRKVAFSAINGVALGTGVNVSVCHWGTLGEVKRLLGERRYRHLIGGFALNDEQRELNRRYIQSLNVDFWRAILATTRRHHYAYGGFVRSYLSLQPSAVAHLPAALLHAVKAKPPQTARPDRPT